MAGKLSIKQIQEEAKAWTKHNFPDQPAHHPAIGVIEEIGELADCLFVALEDEDRHKNGQILRLMGRIGSMAHQHLKLAQGIRNGGQRKSDRERLITMFEMPVEDRKKQEKDSIGDILIFLLNYASAREYDAEEILNETWSLVKQRDWRKFPQDGRTK